MTTLVLLFALEGLETVNSLAPLSLEHRHIEGETYGLHIADDKFKCISLKEKLRFRLNLIQRRLSEANRWLVRLKHAIAGAKDGCILRNSFLPTQLRLMMHICIGNPTIIGSDNDLSLGRCQAIIRTNAVISLIGPLRTNKLNLSLNSNIYAQENDFENVVCKMSAILCRPHWLHDLIHGLKISWQSLISLQKSFWLARSLAHGKMRVNDIYIYIYIYDEHWNTSPLDPSTTTRH